MDKLFTKMNKKWKKKLDLCLIAIEYVFDVKLENLLLRMTIHLNYTSPLTSDHNHPYQYHLRSISL